MKLETALRQLAKDGELNYICLVPVANEFEATYTPATEFGHSYARHADPVTALLAAINGMPPKGQRPRNYSATYRADPKRSAPAEPWDITS